MQAAAEAEAGAAPQAAALSSTLGLLLLLENEQLKPTANCYFSISKIEKPVPVAK